MKWYGRTDDPWYNDGKAYYNVSDGRRSFVDDPDSNWPQDGGSRDAIALLTHANRAITELESENNDLKRKLEEATRPDETRALSDLRTKHNQRIEDMKLDHSMTVSVMESTIRGLRQELDRKEAEYRSAAGRPAAADMVQIASLVDSILDITGTTRRTNVIRMPPIGVDGQTIRDIVEPKSPATKKPGPTIRPYSDLEID